MILITSDRKLYLQSIHTEGFRYNHEAGNSS